MFSCEFCEISKDAFFAEHLIRDIIIIYSSNNEQASIAVFIVVFCFTHGKHHLIN